MLSPFHDTGNLRVTWQEALEIVVARGGQERFRQLCADDSHDREYWRASMLKKASFPSIVEQGKNAMAAAGHVASAVISGEQVKATQEQHDARKAICNACVELVDDRCRLCGCWYEAKIWLATERCPHDPPYWERVA